MRSILLLLALLSSVPAWACSAIVGFDNPIEARRVIGTERAYFHRSAHANERRGAFVVTGDIVLISQTSNGFACAHFVNRAGVQTSGWLQLPSLAPEPEPPATDWAGRWSSGPEQTITITRSPDGLSLDGNASYGASDPVRVQNGAVNEGTIAANFQPRGADAAFTINPVDGATLPYTAGQPRDCRLRLARRGPYLMVEDNLACGGHNVTFTGIYRRS